MPKMEKTDNFQCWPEHMVLAFSYIIGGTIKYYNC